MSDDKPEVPLDFKAPAPQQFNGADILNKISESVRTYIHLSDPQAVIIAAWVAHTYATSSATATPYLHITSAVKQSGKSRLLEVLSLLSCRPWLTSRTSAAALVRKIDQSCPTLLLDEVDAALKGPEEYTEALRGILNAGFYPDGVVSLCVGQGSAIAVKDFKAYCAKAIAGIGSLPDTVTDRSIPLRLERKRPGEVVARFRREKAKKAFAETKSQLSGWVSHIAPQLKNAEPLLPDELSDRQQDACEPLFAIADNAGGEWPKMVRDAAVKLFASSDADDQNIGVRLLADIRLVFDDKEADRIFSEDLVSALAKIETSPWAEWKNAKPMTVIQLARLLKSFKVSPHTVRDGDITQKGYERKDFDDAWGRYLRPEPSTSDFRPVTASQTNNHAGLKHFSARNKQETCDDSKSEKTPVFTRGVTVCRVEGHIESKDGKAKVLPTCPKCGSFALYPVGSDYECQTCTAAKGAGR